MAFKLVKELGLTAMKNIKFFLYILLILCLISISGIIWAKDISGNLELIRVKGWANRDEIGGEGLNVVSLWDSRPVSVSEDGSFITVISNQRPQKISLLDNKKRIRALLISLPDYSNKVVFDAESTAVAVLFYSTGSSGQFYDVFRFLKALENKPAFQDLVGFLKQHLRHESLEELIKNDEYAAIFDACKREVFGDDQKAIKDSLRSAQKELEKVLQ